LYSIIILKLNQVDYTLTTLYRCLDTTNHENMDLRSGRNVNWVRLRIILAMEYMARQFMMKMAKLRLLTGTI